MSFKKRYGWVFNVSTVDQNMGTAESQAQDSPVIKSYRDICYPVPGDTFQRNLNNVMN